MSTPVVARGDEYVVASDLAAIDSLFGWRTESHPPPPASKLVGRLINLLEAAIRYAEQLPGDHFDDVIPGQEGIRDGMILPDGTPLRRADGTPFVQHHTYFGVITHILAHGRKFVHVAEDPSTDLFSQMAVYYPFGEPDKGATMADVMTQLRTTVRDIRSWWERADDRDMGQVHIRNSVPVTLYEQLQATAYSTAQHTRQLEDVLRMLGIEPNVGLVDEDFEGLRLPSGIWG